MSKEMLFLCDVYDAWLSKNKLPHRCASELLYGADTMDKLTVKQSYWLEDFISTWDVISQTLKESLCKQSQKQKSQETNSWIISTKIETC